ncbi:hypothetical protein NDA11_000440 [Ustilago hordei]|nr:hypothetical protein NDA10_006846 [Ustilago hordei]KAJ1570512.1 hypothetical protein NDA11_000440 [Ustilago hordei]KAJ1587278.1 hypothetical protein NDA15_004031 [Ustilago hordei]KAJ1589867.1 hypothetical protein NDA12_001758 [Ustilago hordei]KAJ1602497.1 hypothetical protein NDA14_006014 [Ustilago hordei]
MIGYDNKHKGWKFHTPEHMPSIRWSNSATFHEDKGWHERPKEKSPLQIGFESLEAEGTRSETIDHEPILEPEEINIQDPSSHASTTQPIDTIEDNQSEIAIEDIIGEANMTTMNLTPTLREALDSDEAQQWQEAIWKELDGLKAMGTWEIVDVLPNTKLVDSKIVLCLKLDADGIPVRHKARLVARGFTQ